MDDEPCIVCGLFVWRSGGARFGIAGTGRRRPGQGAAQVPAICIPRNAWSVRHCVLPYAGRRRWGVAVRPEHQGGDRMIDFCCGEAGVAVPAARGRLGEASLRPQTPRFRRGMDDCRVVRPERQGFPRQRLIGGISLRRMLRHTICASITGGHLRGYAMPCRRHTRNATAQA